MSKRIMALVLAAMMCLSLCTGAFADAEGFYKAGTYKAAATGKVGDVEVEVVFSKDMIESVTVTNHNETVGIGDNAVARIPEAIVSTQSLNVDAVAGATVTSDAILEAAADCVAQAGGDVEMLKTLEYARGTDLVAETLDCDIAIVGGGGSGMAACIRATELGKKVILIEKMPFIGGAISISGGNQVVMGSQMQKDLGVTEDSVESMYNDFMANGNDLNVPELLTLYAENVGATSDWLQAAGVTFNIEGGLHKLAEYSYDRELAYTGGGSGAAAAMRALIDASGATVLLDTRATELICDANGAVVGVKATGTEKEYTVNAGKVLLATGGYGYNDALLTEELQNALYYGPVSSTGDGIVMATAIGADTRLMEYGKRYPNGVEVSEGIAKSTINGNIVGWTMSAILVNAKGERVVNEKASNHDILEVELAQPEQMLYLLLDNETFQAWREKLLASGFNAEEFDNYLAANGASCPVFISGNTLSDVEATAGMAPGALTATVERYNGFVAAGNDEDFGRLPEYMQMPVGDGPYYLIEQQPRFATTMGGLVVNADLEVLTPEGNAIPGLYASGETVGGVMGTDSPSGANNGWAVTSGKLAAEQMAGVGSAD